MLLWSKYLNNIFFAGYAIFNKYLCTIGNTNSSFVFYTEISNYLDDFSDWIF